MKKQNIKHVLLILFIQTLMLPLSAQTILLKDNFETNADAWELFTAAWLGVSADMNVLNGELAITNISHGSTDAWHTQAVTYKIPLQYGTVYKLSFDAYAEEDRPCHLFLGENGGDFTPYFDKNITIGTSKSTHEYIFIMTEPSDAMSKFAFEFGISNKSVYIDNVVIQTQNMIENHDFSASNSISPFISFAAGWLGVSVKDTVLAGEATMANITGGGGSQPWHVQLLYEELRIDSGYTYFLSFNAIADAPRPCHIFLGEAGGDFTPYFDKNMEIADSLTNFQYEFAMYEPTDNVAKLAFEIGSSDINTRFDNIVLNKIGTAPKLPVAGFSASVTSGTKPLTVQFTDESKNAVSWKWDFGDGNTSTDQNPKHVYDSIGVFTISLKVSNGYAEDTKVVTEYISSSVSTGIENISSSGQVELYPNPADNFVTIQSNENCEIEVVVFNYQGQQVIPIRTGLSSITIDTKSWVAGVYLIHIKAGNKIGTKRLIIR